MTTTAEVNKPVTAVGNPSWMSSEEHIRRMTAVATMPVRADLPPCESVGIGMSVPILPFCRCVNDVTNRPIGVMSGFADLLTFAGS